MYEYEEDNPATWRVHEAPPKDKAFQNELNKIAGLNPHKKPILRVVWGGSEKSDKYEKSPLKYHCGWTPLKTIGFEYKQNGETYFAASENLVPKGVLAIPKVEQIELGMLRWVIEKWTSPADLDRRHRFTNRLNKFGDKVLREFPRQGIYETFLIVDSKENKYRPVGGDLLPIIKSKYEFELQPFEEQEARYQLWKKQNPTKPLDWAEVWDKAHDGLPKDEVERRAEMASIMAKSDAEYLKQQTSLTVYQ